MGRVRLLEEALVARRHALIGYFRRRGLTEEVSRDLAQETFLAALEGLERYRGEARLETWLFAIARNVLRNYFRSEARPSGWTGPERVVVREEPDSMPPDLASFADLSARSPEARLLEEEREELFGEALRELPGPLRRCLERRLEGLRYREIAALLGIPVADVRDRLYRARQRLRGRLEEVLEGVPASPNNSAQVGTRPNAIRRGSVPNRA